MRFKGLLFAAALIFAWVSAPAVAQTEIKANPNKDFKHKQSGIVLRPLAAGLPRVSITQFDEKQLDVAANYRTSDDREITTVFVFRNVTGDVPLWFDRIQHAVAARKELSSPTLAIPPAAFTPAGQANARGLHAAYAGRGTPWTSTAAALTATGDWYVAVRASSQSLTPQQLLARIDQTFAALRWPKERVASPAAEPVKACPTALVQAVEDARPVEDQGSMLLASALTASVEKKVKSAVEAAPPRWCRDAMELPNAGVFRPDGATDRYLVAFEDAGRGIWVAPNGLAGILMGAKNDDASSFLIELVTIDSHIGYGSFKTLPNIAQAMWTVDHGTQHYVTSTWGKSTNISINSDSLKD